MVCDNYLNIKCWSNVLFLQQVFGMGSMGTSPEDSNKQLVNTCLLLPSIQNIWISPTLVQYAFF